MESLEAGANEATIPEVDKSNYQPWNEGIASW